MNDMVSRSSGAIGVLASLLEARTGQRLSANRVWRIETALGPLIKECGFDTLDQLAGAVLAPGGALLAERTVDALLNQESSFFRDAGVFDLAVDAAAALAAEVRGRPVRIWSAGCSTGQEPLSLAMGLADRDFGSSPRPEIVATDVSSGALARARLGRFTQFEIQRGLPVRQMIRWFDAVDAEWVAKPELLAGISFRRHNLAAPAPAGRFDMIFCRNVLLYLAPDVKHQVFARLAAALRPGGLLVLGAGETVIGQTDALVPSRRFRGMYEPAPAEPCALRRAAG